MPKTEIEMEIHRRIIEGHDVIETGKKTWHDGKWVDIVITYEICGAYHKEAERQEIFVAVNTVEPPIPTVSQEELKNFIENDLKRRIGPLRRCNMCLHLVRLPDFFRKNLEPKTEEIPLEAGNFDYSDYSLEAMIERFAPERGQRMH